jgi:hypothetical protein
LIELFRFWSLAMSCLMSSPFTTGSAAWRGNEPGSWCRSASENCFWLFFHEPMEGNVNRGWMERWSAREGGSFVGEQVPFFVVLGGGCLDSGAIDDGHRCDSRVWSLRLALTSSISILLNCFFFLFTSGGVSADTTVHWVDRMFAETELGRLNQFEYRC